MANNRIYLVHRPTGLGVFIGKRMGWGWYDAPEAGEIQALYDRIAEDPDGSQDDFVLLMEDCEQSSCIDANVDTAKEGNILRFKLPA